MASRKNLKLASFDGGGIRSLSQLEIMGNIMHRLNWERQANDTHPMLPCEHFDLIGGSGTGGLIAVMLAKLRMTVEEASEEFCAIIDEVYGQLEITSLERTKRLKQCMEDIMKKKNLPVGAKLLDTTEAEGCLCFVLASPSVNAGTKICFRSYPISSHLASTITVVEAILATCAMQPAFSPVTVGVGYRKKEYIGAGLGSNNPIREVIVEAHSLFGGASNVASLLSVGSGHPGIVTLPSNGKELDIYTAMQDMTNDSMERAREIKEKIGRAGIYFRFSVQQGMQNDRPSQAMDLGWILAQTESYLEENMDELDSFAKHHNAPITVVTLDQLKLGDVPIAPARTVDLDISTTLREEIEILASLKPADLECGSPILGCMEGTRQDILKAVLDWAADFEVPNIFWLKGHPGVGKSAIATSLVERLQQSRRLGSKFFFQRERSNIMTPNALWRTVSYDLARQHPIIRTRLLATLKENEGIQSTVNIETLFQQTIREPLTTSEGILPENLPVIVLDALNECGGLEGQHSDHRVNLMRTVKSWSSLPKTFKLVVTGRGETDIEELFSTTDHQHLEILAGRTVNPNSSADVRKFLEHRFRQIAARYYGALPPDWPGHHIITNLTDKAGGLFIYAETITQFVNRGEPVEQLNRILAGTGAGGMSRLYSWILNASFPDPSLNVIKGFHAIVGTIILAKEPLPVSSLAHLRSIDPATIRYISNGLQSVMDSGDVPRFKHQSFVDFLINRTECPPLFLIDIQHQNLNLTLSCLLIMKRHLRFNICDLKSSYYRNNEVPHLASLVAERIPPYISYSCLFWVIHLADVAFNAELLELVEYFMQNQFLFWLEVLSLIKRVNLGSSIMSSLIDWLRTIQQDDGIATDMKKFVTAFGSVISQSTPHIYLSALPFSPRNSAIAKQYIERYPQTIAIRTGGQRDWPAIQNVLNGHDDYVNTVAFSPDGSRIVSGSWDETIRVWDTETGERVAGPFVGHTGAINSVAFSPDGRRIVSGSEDRTIRVWDASSGEVIAGPFKGHTETVTSVAFSPDGRRIVSGSEDETIRVWDAKTGEAVARPFERHTEAVCSVAFSPDGRRICSGSYDGTILLWDTETGRAVAEPFKGHTDVIRSVAFSPDGGRIVSGSTDKTIRLWDAETGQKVGGPFKGHNDAVESVGFSPDGRRIVSGCRDETIRVWNTETGACVTGPFDGHINQITSVAFSPDGRRIVSGSWDRTIRVWDAEMGEGVVGPLERHMHRISSVTFSLDGKRIVSGSDDQTVRVWNAETGEEVAGPFEGHIQRVSSLAFSPDGRRIASGSWDWTIRVWNAETGEEIAGPFKGHTGVINYIAFSSDGGRIVSGSHDKTIRLWDAETGEGVVGPFEGHTEAVNSVAFSHDGRRIASASHDLTIRVWDAETGQAVGGPLEGHTNLIKSVALSFDGMHIVSGSYDRTIRVWNAETGRQVAGPFVGHTKVINSVAFSPDGRRVVSGSDDHTVQVWDARTGEGIAGPFEGHTSWVNSVAFSRDGRRIASGSYDQTIRLWDVETGGGAARRFEGHNDLVTPATLSPAGMHAFSGSWDQTQSENRNFSSQNSLLFTNSSKLVDGWILGPNSEHLFWVPPTLHTGLWRPGNTAIMGQSATKLDLGRFVHGEDWVRCKDPVPTDTG